MNEINLVLETAKERLYKLQKRRLRQITIAIEATLIFIAIHRAIMGSWNQVVATAIIIALIIPVLICIHKNRVRLGTILLLSIVTLAITYFMWRFEGLKDEVLLVYPGILVFTVIIGNRLFSVILLLFMLVNILLLGYLNSAGIYINHTSHTDLNSGILVATLLLLVGYSVWLLSSDLRNLLFEVNSEHNKVVKSQAKVLKLLHQEQKLRETEDELHKMQSIENIGVLAGGIAHDFNNILTGIFGNISLAKMKLNSADPAYSYLEKTEKSIDRATRLTSQLLTFSKGGKPVKETVVLEPILRETTLFDLSGSNVKPIFDFATSNLQANVDKGQFQQVISNLSINACQAMQDGGHLYISAQIIKLTPYQIKGLDTGKYIKIAIKDEGIGIEEESLKRIFDPYFTTKKKGSGLGLATVYSIIKKHGGIITVNSELGEGTTFTIYLPSSEEQILHNLSTSDCKHSQNKSYNILVMDDDEDILNFISASLKLKQIEVSTSLNGQEMLEKYKIAMDSNYPFDAVIMDLTIPGGVGGKEAVIELLKIDQNAKCIVSSGYADDPIVANFNEYGFKAAISKPFVVDDLITALVRVLS